jgi:hypothetical protein
MVNDIFGIRLLYPSSTSNEQFLALPRTQNELEQSQIFATKISSIDGTLSAFVNNSGQIGWLEYEPNDGNDVQMLLLPSSLTASDGELEIAVDCDLNHEEAANQGYVNDQGEWQNVEITSHFFVKEVDSAKGYILLEARNGYDGNDGGCCQGTAYGVRLYWDTGSNKGTFVFYKKEFTGSLILSPVHAQELPAVIPSFYQTWFAAKFVIYNNTTGDRVRLELWLSPAALGYPEHPFSNQWKRVGMEEDYVGKGWGEGGGECDATADDAPITWAAPFASFGWKDGKVIQFMYTSAREIDPAGSFGEDPEPEPPTEEPENPEPTDPGTPPTAPPDAEPPLTPTTLTKRLTIRREVINNKLCSCDGVDPTVPVPPGGGTGGGGGGGGTGTLLTLYNVALNTSGFARLALVAGSTTNYLRFGQGVTQTSSPWIGKSINRVEITIADEGNPTGGTGGGVHCRIRKASDDSIAATLSPVASETEILNAGKVFIFENLTNTYKMAFNDKLLFEYDGGNSTNYVKIFRTQQPVTTGTKIVWQTNAQDPGEYSDAPALDICARVYTLTP